MKENLFNSVKVSSPKSNNFDLSHDVKFSCNMGQLVPIMVMDCIPGDRVRLSAEALIRFAPMVAPIMHRVDQTIHYFFVPNRLLWKNWESYITNTPDPITGLLPAFPYMTVGENAGYSDLMDYMGIPTPPVGSTDESISALPFAAYQMIYNEWYRDQNLVTPVEFNLEDGNQNAHAPIWNSIIQLRNRAWEHDYLTSALPFAQKGDAVQIPVTQTFDDVAVRLNNTNTPGTTTLDGTPSDAYIGGQIPSTPIVDDLVAVTSDLNPAQPTTINDLRRAFKLQEWLEKAARGGSRYIEMIKSMFGVNSSDKRLQRPEYITGIKTPVQISEVLNTTGTDDAPQGQMAGHGVAFIEGKSGSYYAEEHGYIIGIMSILPRTAYQQGIPKHFLKVNDPFEYYWEQFAHIGEQPIQNREVYAYRTPYADGSETFGYTPRYAEYKFMQNRVAGDFRTTLNFWHMGRIFTAPPALNADFITADPTHRIFAVEDPNFEKMWIHVYNKVQAVRKMPKFGTPTF